MRLDCKKWPLSQSQVSLEEQSDCIKAFQGVFVSLVLEAKPLISDESVCLQSDEEKYSICLHLEELFLNAYFCPSQYFDQCNEISLP